MSLPTRRELEVYEFGPVTLRIGLNPVDGRPIEAFVQIPFKHGSELAIAMHDACIALSKRLQGKHVISDATLVERDTE